MATASPPEPLERTELDEQGWPKGFWAALGTVDEDFDLGDRARPQERPGPVEPLPEDDDPDWSPLDVEPAEFGDVELDS